MLTCDLGSSLFSGLFFMSVSWRITEGSILFLAGPLTTLFKGVNKLSGASSYLSESSLREMSLIGGSFFI